MSQSAEPRSALEPALLAMLDDEDPRSRQAPETVSVTVLFTCPVADLEAAGFVAWTVIPSLPDDGVGRRRPDSHRALAPRPRRGARRAIRRRLPAAPARAQRQRAGDRGGHAA